MAIKYLSGNRLQGTNAERLALTSSQTPAQIGSVYGHFDSSVQASASAWNDQSGNGLNLTVSGASLVSSGQNSLDYLSFDGTNDTAIKSSGISSQTTTGFTWVWLGRLPPTSDTSTNVLVRTTGGSGDYMKFSTTSANTISVESPYSVPSDNNTWTETGYRGQWAVLIFTFTHGGKIRSYAGNASEAVELKTTSSNNYDNGSNIVGLGTGWWIGVNGTNVSQYGDMHTGEIIAFNKALSAIEVSQLGTHLLYKWGVESSAPASLNLEAGSIYEEYDTGDHFIWSGSAWNEMS